MSGEGPHRARHMTRSVAAAAARVGLTDAAVAALVRAHELAMAPRVAGLEDDHDPRYLHPGRTVLVLIQDAGVRHPTTLAAAALVESEFPELEVPSELVAQAVGLEIQRLRDAVPLPHTAGEALAERLVIADQPVRLIALAERLDQLRHAHLWNDVERRRTAHAAATEVYLPVAERTDRTLARRYRWWCRTFARRFLE